jgi:hypothetical protein
MQRFVLGLAVTGIIASSAAFAQDKPLGDVARENRAAKSSQAQQVPKVITNDDLPSGSSGSSQSGGKLSPDKQAFCDELKARKDPGADWGCAALALDMGTEYEDTVSRIIVLSNDLCAASHGSIPTSRPVDPSLASKWDELSALGKRYNQMLEELKNAQLATDTKGAAIQQEEYREMEALPDFRNPEKLKSNPEELQKFLDIEAKYKDRLQAPEAADAGEAQRGRRILLDMTRMGQVCGGHNY